MSSESPIIIWFRQDLRIGDNPALAQAVENGAPILPIYILDGENAGQWAMGGASRWWLHESLTALDASLENQLRVFRGPADTILAELVAAVGAQAVYWNRCYEPWRIARDTRIKQALEDDGVDAQSFNGSLLFEPHTVSKADGTPYKVFTPFYRKGCLVGSPPPPPPLGEIKPTAYFSGDAGDTIASLNLLPTIRWYDSLAEEWTPGEVGAQARFDAFLENGIQNYKEGRNRPDLRNVSRLSPHLHFGEISPHRIWHAAQTLLAISQHDQDVDHFLSEIGWREFSHNLLYHWPDLPTKNLQSKFDAFEWRDDDDALQAWQKGLTGYPIVDAGMRELWQTGYMHNRVRMIVGSFLVKNLRLHWHHGEAWFWDTLVDADLANNSASWQWIAGCGADAAPYFRIFNPVTQGNKFDPNGDYVRRYVPEIAGLDDKYLHSPWTTPEDVLANASITLGVDYPQPIVDLKATREAALAAFKALS